MTGHGTIRLAYVEDSGTELIAFTPVGVCRFIVRFGAAMPIAALTAAMSA